MQNPRPGINSYENLLSQEAKASIADLQIYIPPGPRLGNVVIEANDITKSFDDNILVEGMTFTLPPGGIIGYCRVLTEQVKQLSLK